MDGRYDGMDGGDLVQRKGIARELLKKKQCHGPTLQSRKEEKRKERFRRWGDPAVLGEISSFLKGEKKD